MLHMLIIKFHWLPIADPSCQAFKSRFLQFLFAGSRMFNILCRALRKCVFLVSAYGMSRLDESGNAWLGNILILKGNVGKDSRLFSNIMMISGFGKSPGVSVATCCVNTMKLSWTLFCVPKGPTAWSRVLKRFTKINS